MKNIDTYKEYGFRDIYSEEYKDMTENEIYDVVEKDKCFLDESHKEYIRNNAGLSLSTVAINCERRNEGAVKGYKEYLCQKSKDRQYKEELDTIGYEILGKIDEEGEEETSKWTYKRWCIEVPGDSKKIKEVLDFLQIECAKQTYQYSETECDWLKANRMKFTIPELRKGLLRLGFDRTEGSVRNWFENRGLEYKKIYKTKKVEVDESLEAQAAITKREEDSKEDLKVEDTLRKDIIEKDLVQLINKYNLLDKLKDKIILKIVEELNVLETEVYKDYMDELEVVHSYIK